MNQKYKERYKEPHKGSLGGNIQPNKQANSQGLNATESWEANVCALGSGKESKQSSVCPSWLIQFALSSDSILTRQL